MTPRAWAGILIAVGLIILIAEIYALWSGTPTLSQVVWALHDRYPWIGYPAAFAVGFVGGHFFWPRKLKEKSSMKYAVDWCGMIYGPFDTLEKAGAWIAERNAKGAVVRPLCDPLGFNPPK